MAATNEVPPAQVCLSWIRAKGAVPIPKATGETHLGENLAADRLELDEGEIDRIDAIDDAERVVDFTAAPWNR